MAEKILHEAKAFSIEPKVIFYGPQSFTGCFLIAHLLIFFLFNKHLLNSIEF